MSTCWGLARDCLICLSLVALTSCGRSPAPASSSSASSKEAVGTTARKSADHSHASEAAVAAPPVASAAEEQITQPTGENAEQAFAADAAAEGLDAVAAGVEPPADEAAESESDNEAGSSSGIPAERIMLLTSSGPLLVDLHITIEGEPFRTAFQSLLGEVLTIADADEDGVVTWDEIMTHPRFREGQFGNPPTTTYQAQQEMTRLYDSTSNGRVDPDELVRYLTSNQGTAQPLTLVTSNSQRSYNRDKSPVREWLDVDGDLVLGRGEIANAPRRLRLRDRNDDEILTPMDFVDASQSQPGLMTRRPPKIIGPPKAGWFIGSQETWNEMLAGWETLYSFGSPVTADDLRLGDGLFDKLNIDQDSVLSAYEMEMLTEIEPHMAFDVELSRGDEQRPLEIELTALRLPLQQTHGVLQHQPNRITIQLPGTSLDVFATDAIGYERFDEQARDILQRADGDENDYLSEEEFAAVQPFLNLEFSVVDLDGNQMLVADEIVTLLRQRNIASRSQLRVKADDQPDALWQSLDVNSDGRIDSREIAEAAESLAMLDADEDGEVHLHELRSSMMIGIVRGANGMASRDDQTFQVPAVVRKRSDATPRWFSGMDRNQDQGISWREFLGTLEQFQQLDHDTDGFIDLEEATLAPSAQQ